MQCFGRIIIQKNKVKKNKMFFVSDWDVDKINPDNNNNNEVNETV